MSSVLEQVLSGPLNLLFRSFVDNSLYSESLGFFEAVNNYRKTGIDTSRFNSAQSIHHTFLRNGADKKIRVKPSTLRDIESKISEAPIDLFDDAYQEVVDLMVNGLLPEFQQSLVANASSAESDSSSSFSTSETPVDGYYHGYDHQNEIMYRSRSPLRSSSPRGRRSRSPSLSPRQMSPRSSSTSSSSSNDTTEPVVALEEESQEPDHPLPFNKENVIRKTLEIAPIALSVSLSNFVTFMNNMAQLVFVGRLGGLYSAAAGLSSVYIAVTAFSFCFGMLGAQDTLGSQAFGAKNFQRVSLVFQRAIFIMLLLFVPIAIVWSCTEPILLAVGQDAAVSKLTAKFILIYLPSLPILLIDECLKRYLFAQGIASPALYASLLANVICIAVGFVLVLHTSLGFYGMPISMGISNVLTLIFLGYWTLHKKLYAATWRRITLSELFCWRENIEFMRLGVPDACMLLSEWVGIEIHGIMSGWISVTALAAQSIIFNCNALIFSIPLGGSISTCVVVGNEMGAGRFREAVLTYLVSLFDFEVLAMIIAALLLLLRNVVGHIFTSSAEVSAVIASIIPLWCIFIMTDAVGAIGGGTVRGVGEQFKAAICNLVSFYGVGIPLGYWLAFPVGLNWGLKGLWTGILSASVLAGFLVNTIPVFGDWEKWAIEAQKRSIDEGTPTPLDQIELGSLDDSASQSNQLSETESSTSELTSDLDDEEISKRMQRIERIGF